jgi:hypothetical protein
MCDYGCGQTHTITSNNIGPHSFGDFVYNNDATCTKNGTRTGKCVYGCDVTQVFEVTDTALGHLFKDYEQKDGYRESWCSRNCGAINTITLPSRQVSYFDIELGSLNGGQSGISRVTAKNKGYSFNNYLLLNGDHRITKETAKGLIEESQIYVLSELSFQLNAGYSFGDEIQLYINGALIECPYRIDGDIIYFTELGRFKT